METTLKLRYLNDYLQLVMQGHRWENILGNREQVTKHIQQEAGDDS